jgi:hypothetical protein
LRHLLLWRPPHCPWGGFLVSSCITAPQNRRDAVALLIGERGCFREYRRRVLSNDAGGKVSPGVL